MQVTETGNEGLRRAYAITVPAGAIAAERDRRLLAIGRDLKLPGFRPGKVPAKVVASRYGQAVMGEVLEAQVNEATRQLVADRGLRPAVEPKVEVVNFADGGDLELTLEMEVLPEVPVPDLRGLALERLRATPGDTEIADALAQVVKSNRKLEPVEDARGALPGEVAVCDFVGRLVAEDGTPGEAFPGGSATDMPIDLGGEGFIPGFAEGIAGIAAGETRSVPVTFPTEYGAAEVAGRAAVFEVTCKALQRPVLPELDDAFAQGLGLADRAELETRVRERIQRDYDQLARLRLKRLLLDALAATAAFAVPGALIDQEFAPIWQRIEQAMAANQLDADDQGKDADTLRADYRAIAERRVRLGLLLSEIGRTNSITVTTEELTRALRTEAGRHPGREREVVEYFRKSPEAMDQLRAPIFEDKVVDFLLELAQVTDREVSAAELTMPPAPGGTAGPDGGAGAGGASSTGRVVPD